MSVIFGKYHIDKQPLAQSELVTMRDYLNNWNADDAGIWKNEYVGFGHLMLWNTPESLQEKLPFKSPHSGNVITADARIDNRAELFTALDINNHSIPDSSLILAAYDKWGKDCVQYLNGDFAFVVWDIHQEELFCARDHLGKKPFYYYYDKSVFIWASNMRGIVSLKKLALDDAYIDNAICTLENEPTDTCYKGVKRLEPAHTLALRKEMHIRQYWDIKATKEIHYSSDEEYVEHFKDLLKTSIKSKTRTAFSLGAQLSGGLDSAAIVSLAYDLWDGDKDNFHTFTHCLPPKYRQKVYPFRDETERAKLTIQYKNIKNSHFVAREVQNYFDVLENKLDVFGGLVELGTEEMTRELAPVAEENNVRTVLSGFLGDSGISFRANAYQLEMLMRGKWMHLARELKAMPHPVRSFLKLPLQLLFVEYNRFFKKNNTKDYCFIKPEYRSETLKQNLVRQDYPSTIYSRKRQLSLITSKVMDKRYILENTVGKQFKVETRYPLADKKIIDFSINIPIEQKVRNGVKRYIFRKGVEDVIPNEILNASKDGIYTLPLLHKKFLNSYPIFLDFINIHKKNPIFDKIDFNQLENVLTWTYNIKDQQYKRHGLVVCHFTFLYMSYLLKMLDT